LLILKQRKPLAVQVVFFVYATCMASWLAIQAQMGIFSLGLLLLFWLLKRRVLSPFERPIFSLKFNLCMSAKQAQRLVFLSYIHDEIGLLTSCATNKKRPTKVGLFLVYATCLARQLAKQVQANLNPQV